jgi:TctA family transporter
MVIAVPFGLIFGAVPGIGGRFGLVLALPFMFGMDPTMGAVFLISMHSVVHTGGSIPSILLGIPGGGPDAATVVDGYPMAQKGEAGRAIGASLMSSAVGGVIGAVALVVAMPVFWPLVMSFGPSETFLLAVLGITFMAVVSGLDLVKGLILGCFGLMLSFVGIDPQQGLPRYTLGQLFLFDGIGVMAAVPAIFAIPEMVELAISRSSVAHGAVGVNTIGPRQMMAGAIDVFRHWSLTLRASLIGVFVGLVPGLGGEVASWVSYGHAVQTSSTPERFGKGAVEGVIAPDSANNSKEGGSLLPTLFFGIPGSASMVFLLGAMAALGLQPGPQMMLTRLDLIWTLVWALVASNLVGSLMLAALGQWMTRLVEVRADRLVPFVLVAIIVGCVLGTGSVAHVGVLLVLGALGTLLKMCRWPRAPLAIGLVLGSVTERGFHQAWSLWGPALFLRPGAIILILLIAASVIFYVLKPVTAATAD